MQPVAKLAFLDIAQETVDPRQRLRRAHHPVQPQFRLQPQCARFGNDRRLQPPAPRRVQPVRAGKLVQQRFDPLQPHAMA